MLVAVQKPCLLVGSAVRRRGSSGPSPTKTIKKNFGGGYKFV